MIASTIFLMLLMAALSGLQRRRWVTLALYFACLLSILLLFFHHATSHLDINL